ncbi:MAG: glycerophosphodiester phosphodiesterase [Candidatus Kariarchaeaceae archaeon]|jgi:hypothetical protein
MKLFPNTIEGLIWGMQNFDGIEFDIRLTEDNVLVIHHDPILADNKVIADLSAQTMKSYHIPLFSEFLQNKNVQELVTSGKSLWIELKPNCKGKDRVDRDIAIDLYNAFMKDINQSGISRETIRIISFSLDLLDPFAETSNYPVCSLLPNINECNQDFLLLKALPKVIRHSLKWHIQQAIERNYAGVLFARQFLMGFFSYRHPSYAKMIELMDEFNINLGTNLGNQALEAKYPKLHRFTDDMSTFPRFSKEGEGQIIAHRGTGTKGVKIPPS